MSQEAQQLQVKVSDEILGGVYANNMTVWHSAEEFILDFFTILPPAGKMTARVIVSPSHLKRIVRALNENLGRYETSFGPIREHSAPPAPTVVN